MSDYETLLKPQLEQQCGGIMFNHHPCVSVFTTQAYPSRIDDIIALALPLTPYAGVHGLRRFVEVVAGFLLCFFGLTCLL